MGNIILAGQEFHIAAECHTWRDHGMTFDGNRTRPRSEALKWGVVHWTGSRTRRGLSGAEQVFSTLYRKGLSIHFVITDEGELWQFADPVTTRCAHAGRLNDASLGVEVTGPGWLRGYNGPRMVYEAAIHGWRTEFIDFFPEQQATLESLADTLSEAGVILPMVMTEKWERRGQEQFEHNAGWCGHLHCERLSKKHPKCDPGTAPLIALAEHFAEAEEAETCPTCGRPM